ncbi:hypothetical protein G5I_11829 [Acromyrmex echinatior]|uniref:Uncharacterized protein n=1 Tax=Acromyrmex echinatior TaxID=103372 RepID=F4X0P6_ACREC|nr:hypothetical protein G5I_11829 [Acromyrmex echinatior]
MQQYQVTLYMDERASHASLRVKSLELITFPRIEVVSLVFGTVASRRQGNGIARFRRGEPGKVWQGRPGLGREREGKGGGNLMTPHPGVARTLYLAKKDLITRPRDRAWVDQFDFKKGPPSRSANPRSSIHPTASYVVFRRVLKEEDEVEWRRTRGGGE